MKRYKIEMDDTVDALLRRLADAEGTTKSQILCRAIAYYAYLRGEEEKEKAIVVAAPTLMARITEAVQDDLRKAETAKSDLPREERDLTDLIHQLRLPPKTSAAK